MKRTVKILYYTVIIFGIMTLKWGNFDSIALQSLRAQLYHITVPIHVSIL